MGAYEEGDSMGVIAGGVRRGVETEDYILTKTFKSSEVKVCVERSCDKRCRRLGSLVNKTQVAVDGINRTENQAHDWVFDNVAAAVVFCGGKPMIGCGAEVVEGRVYDETSDFAGLELDIDIFPKSQNGSFVRAKNHVREMNIGVSKD